MVSLYSTSSSPQTFSNLFPNFFQRTTFLFISGLRTPLSVKYIVGLTISRGFNGAIKPSSLPTTNKLHCALEFGASEGWCRYGGIWCKGGWRAGVVMAGRQLPSRPGSTPLSPGQHKISRNPKNLESQNVVLWDVSCRYAQTPAATRQDLGVLLFRPKIVQKPDEPSNSQLTSKQNSIASSFSSAWLHKPALFPG